MIEHSGTVERTEAGRVFVRITSHSACGSCSARQACGLAEAQDKIVEVPTPDAARFQPGDAVIVGVRHRSALAVLLAVLAVTVGLAGWSEGQGALASLGAVVLYYMVLWLFRRRIEHTIQFTITEI